MTKKQVSKKAKYIYRSIVGFFLLLFVAISICYTLLPSIVSHSMSKSMGVGVNISGITLSFDNIRVRHLKVGNPSGFHLFHALKVGMIDVHVPATHFFHKKIVIPTVNLDDVYVGLEFKKKGDPNGNWTVIMNHMNSDSDKGKENSDTEVIVKKLNLTNLEIRIVYQDQPQNNQTVKIPSIQLTDVSSKGGIPTQQLTRLIMRQALKEIFSKENIQNMLKNVLNPDGGGGFFKGLFSMPVELHFKKENNEH